MGGLVLVSCSSEETPDVGVAPDAAPTPIMDASAPVTRSEADFIEGQLLASSIQKMLLRAVPVTHV